MESHKPALPVFRFVGFAFSEKPSARRRYRGQGLLPLQVAKMYIFAMLARSFSQLFRLSQQPSGHVAGRSSVAGALVTVCRKRFYCEQVNLLTTVSTGSTRNRAKSGCRRRHPRDRQVSSLGVVQDTRRSDKASVSPCFDALRRPADA